MGKKLIVFSTYVEMILQETDILAIKQGILHVCGGKF